MLPSKFKNFLKLFLANILVFLAVAIVIEVGGQIYAYFHPAYKVIPFAPHPVMGWRFIPNSDHIVTGDYWYAREFSAEVKINSHGFRIPLVEFAKMNSIFGTCAGMIMLSLEN